MITWFEYVKNPNIKRQLIKINVGCGPNMFPHPFWTNYDHEDFGAYIEYIKNQKDPVYAKYLQDLINYVHNGGELTCIKHDLRDGFPMHEDNSVDIICNLQSIEHISPHYDCPRFLKECYRMLAPGKVLRVTTPDLDLLINAYLSGEMDKFAIEQPEIYKQLDPSAQLAMMMYGSSVEFREDKYAGHKFLYTQKSITKQLNDAGFSDITFYYESGKSKHKIINDEVVDTGGFTHSMIVEAVK